MSTIQDAAARKPAIRQGALRLAGFTRPLLAAYLGITTTPTDPLLSQVYSMLALGEGTQVFPLVGSNGGACLVQGPRRFLVRGRESSGTFIEEAARLVFFLKPPFAPPVSLQIEAQVRLRGGDAAYESRSICLERQGDYAYRLDGHLAPLVSSDWQHVRLLAGAWEVLVAADPFWRLVLDAGCLPPDEMFRCQIGLSHTAQLVGRAPITLKRHLDGGLPVAGYSREHPGFTREGIEEYLAYTSLFPQGLISPRQRQQCAAWQATWRRAYQQHITELVGAPTP